MKKLTLVSITCRRCTVHAFLNLPVYNGRPVLGVGMVDFLFLEQFGFSPQTGETISIG